MKRVLICILVCSLIASVMIGCSEKIVELGKSSSSTNETGDKAENTDEVPNSNNTKESAPVEDVSQKGTEADKTPKDSTVNWKAVLYFSDKNAMYVVKETRQIQLSGESKADGKLSASEKAKIVLEELIKGSKNPECFTSIPEETRVLSTKLDDNTIIVDLSKEFVEKNVGGSAGVTMAIAPIVLSLTELDGVDQVKFKIEGKVVEDFKGHIQLSRAFKRAEYENLIEE